MTPESDAVALVGPLADLTAWTADSCSLARALEVVGTRSAMLIMRAAYYGTQRFDDFARRVGITDAVAPARLRDLTEAGLLRREDYREPGQRTRQRYRLTDMGRDLFPSLVGLLRWGDRYLAGPDGPPVRLEHDECGSPMEVTVRCTAGHAVTLREVSIRLP